MTCFNVEALPLEGLKLVTRLPRGDSRGFFSRVFCSQEMESMGWVSPNIQINHSYTSQKGAVRGLHFQVAPHAEMKLVTCLRGAIFDVMVDIRSQSKTFLEVHTEILSDQNCRSVLIPEGFAHGFQTLTDDVELLYCISESYALSHERGLHPDDPLLDIKWPLPMQEISERDAQHPMINPDFQGICV